jgi:aminoglycoside phosphotransferase (APT) family kinase protein
VNHWRSYYDWMREGVSYPLLERGFDWIEANWPVDEGDTVLSWGDARIGNMMFDGFVPVAVFDWEMVGVGPRGLDVGWMVFLHQFFEGLAHEFDLPGLPDVMVPTDVVARYEKASGVRLDDLYFYEVWAALRHGVVMARVNARRVHFGEAEPPAAPDDAVMHRKRLAEMLESPTA